MTKSHPLLVSADELAMMLGLNKAQVYELARTNKIPCVRLGRKVRFSLKAIDRWIEQGGTPAA